MNNEEQLAKELKDQERFRAESKASTPATLDKDGEFSRFERLTRRLLNVSKKEVDKKRKASKVK